MKSQTNPILKNIIIISLVGFSFMLLFDYLITIEYVRNWNLANLNNLFGSLGFILTAITIYLLYKNYNQQRDEFKKMNELNNNADELQLILYEKNKIDQQVTNLNYKFLKDFKDISNMYFAYFPEPQKDDEELKYLFNEFHKIDKDNLTSINSQIRNLNIQLGLIKEVINNEDIYNILYTSFPSELKDFISYVREHLNNRILTDYLRKTYSRDDSNYNFYLNILHIFSSIEVNSRRIRFIINKVKEGDLVKNI